MNYVVKYRQAMRHEHANEDTAVLKRFGHKHII